MNQLAEPFEPEAGEQATQVGLRWSELESSLERLSKRYGNAAADWLGVESELDDIQQWCAEKIDWSRCSVEPGDEAQTLAQIQVL